MTARRLSQVIALALAALTLWVMIVGSEVELAEPFALEIYTAFAVIVVILFAVVFYALRLATGGSETYWSITRTDQVRPIGWMILAAFTAMFAIGWLLAGPGRLESVHAVEVAYLLSWTLVPAAFLRSGLVAWPARLSRPRQLKLLLVATAAIGVAAVWSYGAYTIEPDRVEMLPIGPMLVTLGAVIVGATAEEVVSRVLLLTALLSLTGSRFQAVFLSSFAFAMMHVPGQFAQPVTTADWELLRQVVHDYSPVFLVQFAIGLLLGVIWLRTGSITLIAATHAILNTGKVLASGL